MSRGRVLLRQESTPTWLSGLTRSRPPSGPGAGHLPLSGLHVVLQTARALGGWECVRFPAPPGRPWPGQRGGVCRLTPEGATAPPSPPRPAGLDLRWQNRGQSKQAHKGVRGLPRPRTLKCKGPWPEKTQLAALPMVTKPQASSPRDTGAQPPGKGPSWF